jgi:hypothetical protein
MSELSSPPITLAVLATTYKNVDEYSKIDHDFNDQIMNSNTCSPKV